MINTLEVIILVLLTVALVVTGPLIIAEGATKMIYDAASKAWTDWTNFVDWLYDSIDNLIFGKPGLIP